MTELGSIYASNVGGSNILVIDFSNIDICGNLNLNSGLEIDNNYGVSGEALISQGSNVPPIWGPTGGDGLSTTTTDLQRLYSDLKFDWNKTLYVTNITTHGINDQGYGHNYMFITGGFISLDGGYSNGTVITSNNVYARVRESDGRKFYGSHSYQVASDDRLKHNEVDLSNCLQTIRKLNPQKYQKTNVMKEADFNGKLQDGEWVYEAGLIAQDLLKIPELTWCVGGGGTEAEKPDDTPKEQPYSVAYHNVEMYHLQATRELDQQVQQLKAALNELLIASGKNPI